LDNVTTIEGSFVATSNGSMTSLSLPALVLANEVNLSANAFSTLSLPSLETVTESLSLSANQNLATLDLSSLETVNGSITVTGNMSLTSMGELGALSDVGGLMIAGNGALPQCEVDALDARLGNPCGNGCMGNDAAATCN
jgi:hypothetical protein